MAQNTRNTRKLMSSGGGLVVAVILLFAINIIANAVLTSFRLDLTEDKLFTLSDGTRNILGDIDEPVRLRLYYSAKLFSGIPQIVSYGTRVRDLLQEYVAESGGKVELTVIDPAPFSEAEDEAVGYGIRKIPVNQAGEFGYFGLVGTNTTDDELVLPFLQPSQEEALEYDITKLVYNLANPTKRTIGIVSGLNVFGSRTSGAPGWTVISTLKELFDVRTLGLDTDAVDADIDTLLVIHPKDLPRSTIYAIDQFVLRGGKAMIFVDPFAEEDQVRQDPDKPMILPKRTSNLVDLFAAWGVTLDDEKVVGDLDAAIRVGYQAERGPQEIEYLPWLRLDDDNLNGDDFITNQLQQVNIGSAGALVHDPESGTEFTPLLKTGTNSGFIDRDGIIFVRDPRGFLENFEPTPDEYVVAARVRGNVKTAFPQGRPRSEEEKRAPADTDYLTESTTPVNVVIVADTDILSDRFWVRVQDFLGVRVPSPFADNGSFVVNTVDNLGGNDDLISLRSRRASQRPFDRVLDIEKAAEAQFRDKERALVERLEQTEARIRELESQRAEDSSILLTPEQREAIEGFRAEQLKIRKELRAVQLNLKRDIERLGAQLKFINIGLVPLLVAVAAVFVGVAQSRRRAA